MHQAIYRYPTSTEIGGALAGANARVLDDVTVRPARASTVVAPGRGPADHDGLHHAYGENGRADGGVLVLAVAVRARARGDLPRRVPRRGHAVCAATRRTRARTGGPLGPAGTVSRLAELVLP